MQRTRIKFVRICREWKNRFIGNTSNRILEEVEEYRKKSVFLDTLPFVCSIALLIFLVQQYGESRRKFRKIALLGDGRMCFRSNALHGEVIHGDQEQGGAGPCQRSR